MDELFVGSDDVPPKELLGRVDARIRALRSKMDGDPVAADAGLSTEPEAVAVDAGASAVVGVRFESSNQAHQRAAAARHCAQCGMVGGTPLEVITN